MSTKIMKFLGNRRPDSVVSMLLFVSFLLFAAPSSAFRCDGNLISAGLSKSRVLAKCGEPNSKDIRTDEYTLYSGAEYWFYKSKTKILKISANRLAAFYRNPGSPTNETEWICRKRRGSKKSNTDFIVTKGDSPKVIISKCGNPVRTALEELKTHMGVEEWVYDRGTEIFIRILVFEDGLLKEIIARGHGFNEPFNNVDRCLRTISSGDTKYEVLMKCKEPVSKKQKKIYRTVFHGKRWIKGKDKTSITADFWHYDFGPNYFIRDITFEDNRLKKIENGFYGEAR